MNQKLSKWFFRTLLVLSAVISIKVILEGDYELILPLLISLWGYKEDIKDTILGIDKTNNSVVQSTNNINENYDEFQIFSHTLVSYLDDKKLSDEKFNEIVGNVWDDFSKYDGENVCQWCESKEASIVFEHERSQKNKTIDTDVICLECFVGYVEGYVISELNNIED